MSALRQQANAFISANLSPAARSARLARLAKQMRDDLISSHRASATYTRFVDGKEGAPEEAVRGTGGGSILYNFSYAAEAAVFALAFLRQRSPAASGRFRDSFWVAVDGRFIRAADFNAESVPPGAEITIGNTQPYNRRVDVQQHGDRKLSYSVPAGLYDDCVRAVKRQFTSTVGAKRIYDIDFPGKYTLRKNQVRKSGKRAGTVHRSAGSKVQSPAIVLSVAI